MCWWNKRVVIVDKEKNQSWRKRFKTRRDNDKQNYTDKRKECKKMVTEESMECNKFFVSDFKFSL